jgi:DNA-binding transcriptional MerR regulator
MPDESPPAFLIGELGRRTGLSPQLLRAWERRYGLLQPVRTSGGYRLYTEADEGRVRLVQANLARGLSAAEAAAAALQADNAYRTDDPHGLDGRAAALAASLEAFDEPAAQAALDRLLADFTVESVLAEVVLPYFRLVGQRWADGQFSVASEHFASNVIRGRLAGLARGWGQGQGPRALLACPPDERHDLGLMAFGIVLHRSGWRVHYLGTDTPVEEMAQAARHIRPAMTVVAAVTPGRYQQHVAGLSRLASAVPLGLAGAGATQALATATGARLLAGDPLTEARNAHAWAG